MAYDDNIPLDQGSIKISEVAMDRASDLLGADAGASTLKIIEASTDVLGTLLSKQSFVLTSTGRIAWETVGSEAEIDFVKDIAFVPATNIDLYVLQNEAGTDKKTYTIRMQGSSVSSINHFNSIQLQNNQLLYLEIDKSLLHSSGGTLIITNGVDYAGTPGKRLRKTTVSPSTEGIDRLLNPISSGTDTTMYIPLAIRIDFQLTSGITEKNIWWIPHGIRWPSGTTSTLGAIVVDGTQVYPNYFVAQNENSLIQVIDSINGSAAGGGVILLYGDLTLTADRTIPDNVIFIGRGFANHTLSVGTGANLIMGSNCRLQDMRVVSTGTGSVRVGSFCTVSNVSFYGEISCSANGMLKLNSNATVVEKCQFSYATAASVYSIGILVDGNENRIRDCKFFNIVSSLFKTGIFYNTGAGNTEWDTYAT